MGCIKFLLWPLCSRNGFYNVGGLVSSVSVGSQCLPSESKLNHISVSVQTNGEHYKRFTFKVHQI